MALVETGLYFGKGDGVDDERSEVHSGVPVAVEDGGVTVTCISISRVPDYGGNESCDDAGSAAQVPSDHAHRCRVEREEPQLVTRDAVNPSEHSEPKCTSSQHDQYFGFAATHRSLIIPMCFVD